MASTGRRAGESVSRAAPTDASWVAAIHLGEHETAPVGSGVVLDHQRVLTCAHVAWPGGQPHERQELWVAFPRAGTLERRRVDHTIYPEQRSVNDLVVLYLTQPVPAGVRPAPVRFPPADALQETKWWAYGFANGDQDGNAASGSVGEVLGYGKLRLDSDSRYHVEQGFSGAGLWAPGLTAVVGMVCQAHSNGDGRAISLAWADSQLPQEKFRDLAERLADQIDEPAATAWGWSPSQDLEVDQHWSPRARGVVHAHEQGLRFRGRRAALSMITNWLTKPQTERCALVVTGRPGSGKSAVLGRVVLATAPELYSEFDPRDSSYLPPPRSVACAVHAKGKTALAVAAEIARAVSRPAPDRIDELTGVVRQALRENQPPHAGPFSVIIDALDEAATPKEARSILRHIVLPLVETCADLEVRVVVGSRLRDAAGDLVAILGGAAQLVDLDSPDYLDRKDLAAFSLATLQLLGNERADSPYARLDVAYPVADRIAELADGNFLVAGLVARSYGMHDEKARAPSQVSFHTDLELALLEQVEAVDGVDEIPAIMLLTALAFAEAPGFTAALWSDAVKALNGVEVPWERLVQFARSAAANFLVESPSSDNSTFRLFHQAFHDVLLEHRNHLHTPEEDHRQLTKAFMAHGQASGWAQAPSYLLHSLAGHAARGRLGRDLLADPAYLLHADLRRILRLPELEESADARQTLRTLRLTPQAADADPPTRAAMFAVTEALEDLGGRWRTLATAMPYRAAWAAARPRTERIALPRRSETAIHAMCAATLDGQPLLATAGSDGIVRVWDVTAGEEVQTFSGHRGRVLALCTLAVNGSCQLASAGDDGTVRLWPTAGAPPLTIDASSGRLVAMAAATVGSSSYLAVADMDGTVLIGKMFGGGTFGRLPDVARRVRALCTVEISGRSYLATASNDGRMRLWLPESCRLLKELNGNAGQVHSIHAITIEGIAHLVTIGVDGQVRLWDPTVGNHVSSRQYAHNVLAVCPIEIEGNARLAVAVEDRAGTSAIELVNPINQQMDAWQDRSVVSMCAVSVGGLEHLACGHSDGTVRILDPASLRGRAWGLFSEAHAAFSHADKINAVCGTAFAEHDYVVTAGNDGKVRVWSAVTGKRHADLGAHERGARAVHSLTLDDQPLLASGGGDGIVKLWDLRTQELVLNLAGHSGSVCAIGEIIFGQRSHLVTSGDDGTVRLWDLQAAREVRILDRKSRPGVLTTLSANGHAYVAAAAKPDETVTVWDLAADEDPLRLRGTYGWARAMCLLTIENAVHIAIGGDDGTVRLLDLEGKERFTHNVHTGTVRALHALELYGQPYLASAGADHTVHLRNLRDGRTWTIPVHHPATAIAELDGLLAVALSAGVLTLRLEEIIQGT